MKKFQYIIQYKNEYIRVFDEDGKRSYKFGSFEQYDLDDVLRRIDDIKLESIR